jgi:hypothetical protein
MQLHIDYMRGLQLLLILVRHSLTGIQSEMIFPTPAKQNLFGEIHFSAQIHMHVELDLHRLI